MFEEEAPSSVQRRLAYDFYIGITSLVDIPGNDEVYPSLLDIIELHKLHIEAIRASIGEEETIPEYTLTHVLGASKRVVAHAEAEPTGNKVHQQMDKTIHLHLQMLLEEAANLETIDFPLVSQREAVAVQRTLWEEARTFLEKSYLHYSPDMIGSTPLYPRVRYFPEENANEAIRNSANFSASYVEGELEEFEESAKWGTVLRFGAKEALISATNYGYNDKPKYNLVNVLGAAKRRVLGIDMHSKWGDYKRRIFTAHKLLDQAVANSQSES